MRQHVGNDGLDDVAIGIDDHDILAPNKIEEIGDHWQHYGHNEGTCGCSPAKAPWDVSFPRFTRDLRATAVVMHAFLADKPAMPLPAHSG